VSSLEFKRVLSDSKREIFSRDPHAVFVQMLFDTRLKNGKNQVASLLADVLQNGRVNVQSLQDMLLFKFSYHTV